MTIAEISKRFELSQDTLRYYERIGLVPAVHRKSGIRDYREEDCKWIQFAKCMRAAGLPIEVLIEYVSLFAQGASTAAARKQLLLEQRSILAKKVAEMQEVLDRLDKKIERYDQIIAPREKELMDSLEITEP